MTSTVEDLMQGIRVEMIPDSDADPELFRDGDEYAPVDGGKYNAAVDALSFTLDGMISILESMCCSKKYGIGEIHRMAETAQEPLNAMLALQADLTPRVARIVRTNGRSITKYADQKRARWLPESKKK